MLDKFVQTRSGRLHFLNGGSGPPLILLHSNGGSAYDYEFVFERLTHRYEVFAWDMPGQGDSDPLPRHLSVDDYATALREFMDGLSINRATIVGASIGAAICVSFGAHYSALAEHLVIVECPCRDEAEWKKLWWRTEVNFGQPVQQIEAVKPRLNNVTPEFLTRWNIDRNKAGAKTMMSVMWALRDYDATRDLARLPPGSVVVYGDKGPTIANKAAFTAAMRDPRIEIMPASGHFPMVDDPDAFCAILESFGASHP